MNAKEIAGQNCILLATVGSELFGTSIGTGDHDMMGVCIPPPAYVLGLSQFEQWVHHDQPEGQKSGPGDEDVTIYSLKKYVSLALKGNPSLLSLFFLPQDKIITDSPEGQGLRGLSEAFASRVAGKCFLGYMQAQRDRLMGIRGGKHTNRPDLIEEFGFDTKYAMHMVRLSMQGVEYMRTGRMTFPIPDPDGQWLRDLRLGLYTKDEAVARANELEAELKHLLDHSPLPPGPDFDRVNQWLQWTQLHYWGYT